MSDIFNVWAVLVGIIASSLLGALWYSPLVFRRSWTRARGRAPEEGRSVYVVMVLTAIATTIAFGWWAGPEPSIEEAVVDGFVVGLFFAATALGLHYAFAGRGLRLWLIDAGFQVARFVLLGVIFGLIG
jgi:hypothetical protein